MSDIYTWVNPRGVPAEAEPSNNRPIQSASRFAEGLPPPTVILRWANGDHLAEITFFPNGRIIYHAKTPAGRILGNTNLEHGPTADLMDAIEFVCQDEKENGND